METVEKRLSDGSVDRFPLLMGVLNVTPDSFYDGGAYASDRQVRDKADALLSEGADIVDVGGESSRPGAPVVPVDEQIARIGPALLHLAKRGAFASVDTTSTAVAEFALSHGARMVNDVSCLRDPALASISAKYNAWLVITHSRKPMTEMSGFSQWPDDDYADIVEDVMRDWGRAKEQATTAGLDPGRVIFDPGFGFSKNAKHSLELLRRLAEFQVLGCPLLAGPGRKSFISAVDPSPPARRLGGTIVSALHAAQAGAHILRIHDVQEVRQALLLSAALSRKSTPLTVDLGHDTAPPTARNEAIL